jgi:hypothetical protein
MKVVAVITACFQKLNCRHTMRYQAIGKIKIISIETVSTSSHFEEDDWKRQREVFY